MNTVRPASISLNQHHYAMLDAIFERMFPADGDGPGAAQIGVTNYLDQALSGAYTHLQPFYRLALEALDREARKRCFKSFIEISGEEQDAIISALEQGKLLHCSEFPGREFFAVLRTHLQEGLFSDPIYGGNKGKAGWKVIKHPGVWLENSAAENLQEVPADKGGRYQSLADLRNDWRTAASEIAGFDPLRGQAAPAKEVDVILVGVGSMNSIVAPILAKAGLKVIGFEPGPFRQNSDYLPDELGAAYYCRATMGPKFGTEIPRWRRNAEAPDREATFSLGRMMNSVGGSIIHYGAWMRRFHPHHFRIRSYIQDRWGTKVIPTDCALVDWPVSYEELEPYYTELEHAIGIAGDETNPFIKRSKPLPMPPTRPFRLGEIFSRATRSQGLHPHPVAVGVNTIPYQGRPATNYTAWSNGFGSYTGEKWDPSLTCVPRALATGNFDLRTGCQVVRILTDENGHAAGVEYIDALGRRQIQPGRTVILGAYTFENIRLMFLSGSATHPSGIGGRDAQLGRYFMTKMFAHVDGFFPNVIFNRHTGPAAQGVVIDDFVSAEFDFVKHGFIGGATLGAEQQFLPIQISREALPQDVCSWGKSYRHHLKQWQHFGVVRIQPDALPYSTNYLELDPFHRDTSGLGQPVLRITYDLRENERKLADWMEQKAEEILGIMGATKTWRGASFTGVGSSHDFGGARMGNDPTTSVVNRDLEVHDAPGVYVFSGATFPSCVGINPTLTLAAICCRAADQLVQKLKKGE
ncbi:MAG: gluconate 2-dehydrogenase subunit 3 family protein [Verrucomicrobia bacterium]|nr:gluconate 2-dehydrogenase subunit 3 family protein [Verrucomicrobiota bacterium]